MSNIANINLSPFLNPKFDHKVFAALENAKTRRSPLTEEAQIAVVETPEMVFGRLNQCLSEKEKQAVVAGLDILKKLSPNSNQVQICLK
jgi:hypothetical protein